jgi:hypothetical protein
MDPLELVEKLADRARREPVPAVEVGRAIMARIRERQRHSLVPLWIYAGWLAPTAAAVTFFAVRVWSSLAAWMSSLYWSGPLDGFLSPLRQVMP